MSLNSWLNARERTATLSVAPCAATAAALRGSSCAPNWPCAAEKSAKLRATTKTSFFIQPRPKPTLPEYKELRRRDSIPSRPTEFLPPPRPSFCTTCRISVVVFPWASAPRAATLAALFACQAPHSVQKPSMLHHPDKIKNPAKMHLSYAPSCTINVVGLNRKDPASKPGLSRLCRVGCSGTIQVQTNPHQSGRRVDLAHT